MKLKLTKLMLLLCLALSDHAMASEFKNRVGAGIQYGGLVGWQGSYNQGNNSFRIAFGYAGFAYGYDRYIGDNYSLGVQGFGNQANTGLGLSANYFLNSRHSSGAVIGIDLYRGYNTTEFVAEAIFDIFFQREQLEIDADLETSVLVSIGYQF